jgi:hypothetical protein
MLFCIYLISAKMKRKLKTIDCFFQRDNPRATPIKNPNLTNVQDSDPINLHTEAAELNQQETLATTFERDPSKRVQILRLPFDQQDEARRFYISEGPYQVIEITLNSPCVNRDHRESLFSYEICEDTSSKQNGRCLFTGLSGRLY